MTECWRAELRKHNIRVILMNPSEVVTNFFQTANLPQKVNETKLRGEEIAFAVKADPRDGRPRLHPGAFRIRHEPHRLTG